MNWHAAAIWSISLASIALVLIRPKGLPEAVWAAGGACLLVICRLMSLEGAAVAVQKGVDVYLFLVGMMVMSELARREGVFDWVAVHAVRASKGSRRRLFVLIYGVGIVVTVFLSNDATAVVLTPAVLAAVRAAEAEALPYLLICAFIANAASFVLPISNPANLVVYDGGLPPLGEWLLRFGLASAVSIFITFVALRWLARKYLQGPVKTEMADRPLTATGKLTLFAIGVLAATLMTASAFNLDLGAPTFIAGLVIAAAISLRDRGAPMELVKGLSWSILPLVAGLFVMVEALNGVGALTMAAQALARLNRAGTIDGALGSGFGIAILFEPDE